MVDSCRICGSADSYATEVGAKGGYGPNLLPVGGLFAAPKFRIQVCGGCGLVEWFVPERYLAQVREKFPKTASAPR
jgi:hypothetical protein